MAAYSTEDGDRDSGRYSLRTISIKEATPD
jgi:hypothetical protein